VASSSSRIGAAVGAAAGGSSTWQLLWSNAAIMAWQERSSKGQGGSGAGGSSREWQIPAVAIANGSSGSG
jgi:hypothetical protein